MTDILLKEKIKKKSSMCYNIKKNTKHWNCHHLNKSGRKYKKLKVKC